MRTWVGAVMGIVTSVLATGSLFAAAGPAGPQRGERFEMSDDRGSAESVKMRGWLRPYLDADYEATEGPDRDKAFIRQCTAKIAAALPEKLSAQPERPRRVLVLTRGTYGALHVPAAAGLLILLRDAAERYGAFELTELYDDDTIDARMLRGFDAVVLNNVGMTNRPEVYNRLLPDYVRAGGGLFAMHSDALLFMRQPDAEYNRLLGAYVDIAHTQYGHPGKHGDPFPVVLPDPDEPLAAAFRAEPAPLTLTCRWLNGQERVKYQVTVRPPQTLADELYALVETPGQQDPPHVLVQVDRRSAPQVYPETARDFAWSLVWTRHCGKGRVYYSQLGHNMAVYSVPCVARAALDGLQYAVGDLDEKTVSR